MTIAAVLLLAVLGVLLFRGTGERARDVIVIQQADRQAPPKRQED